jgi:hypothetical protein
MLLLLLQETATTLATPAPTPPPGPVTWLELTAGWVALGFLGAVGIAILYYIFTERIDLSQLISEPSGDASMSRFQLLVFTFVIAASLFLITASPHPPAFPKEIPNGILVLLGISASSYLVSKGIQFSSPEGASGGVADVKIVAPTDTTSAGGATIAFKAQTSGLTNTDVAWSLDPPQGMGTIDAQTGVYTPPPRPAQGQVPTGQLTVKATSVESPTISDTAVVKLV